MARRRRHHAVGVAQPHRCSRSTCCTTASRSTCSSPTAACATATPSRSSTSCTRRAPSSSRRRRARGRASWRSSAWSGERPDDRRRHRQPARAARCSSPCRKDERDELHGASTPFRFVVTDTRPTAAAPTTTRPSWGPTIMSSCMRRHAATLNGRHVLLDLHRLLPASSSPSTASWSTRPSRPSAASTPTTPTARGSPTTSASPRPRRRRSSAGSDSVAYVPETQRLRVALTDTAGRRRPRPHRHGRDGAPGHQPLRPAARRSTQTGPGIYEADAAGLDAGWWTVDLEARRRRRTDDDAALYEARRRLWIKP